MVVGASALVLLIPLIVVAGIARGGWWSGVGIAVVFVAIPILDALLGHDRSNRGTDDARPRWVADLPLFTWCALQLTVLPWAIARLVAGDRTALDVALGTISLGLTTGAIGITVAHELMHRSSRFARALSELLMTSVSYAHFGIEHVFGHHRHVATPRDPASARLGQSVYGFVPRSIVGGLRSAWAIERERCQRRGVAVIGPGNRMLRQLVATAVIYAAIATWMGGLAVAIFAGQSLVAVVMLEIVNYVEHYGLERRRGDDGRYERVAPWHSWNASHRLTNWLLFRLQRHSDHHFLASRPWQALRHHDDVPQLPAGYATMVLVALVPPLWRAVMDPRVARARAMDHAGPALAA